MSTNHQSRKFSFVRSLRFSTARLLLTAVLLAGFIRCDTVDGMNPEADAFPETHQTARLGFIQALHLRDVENITSRNAGSKTEFALSHPDSEAQTAGDCYRWEYIDGEWTLVRVPC